LEKYFSEPISKSYGFERKYQEHFCIFQIDKVHIQIDGCTK